MEAVGAKALQNVQERLRTEGLDIDNFEKRIKAVKRIAELILEIEPPEEIEMIEQFDTPPKQIENTKSGSRRKT